MVSKTWYDFIENDGGLLNNLTDEKTFWRRPEKSWDTEIGCFSHDWQRDWKKIVVSILRGKHPSYQSNVGCNEAKGKGIRKSSDTYWSH